MIVGVEIPSDLRSFTALRAFAAAAAEAGFALVAPPPQRWNRLQPIQTMAALTAAVPGSAVSTGPLLAAVANPVDLAEQIATLDHAAAGRLVVEVRPTSTPMETHPFGIDSGEVPARTAEAIALWRRLWTEDVVDHAGAFYRVPGARPTLRPHAGRTPPIALLAADPRDVAMAVSIDAGLSVDADVTPPGIIRMWVEAAPRSPERPVIARSTVPSPGEVAERLDSFVASGCSHAILRVPGDPGPWGDAAGDWIGTR